MLEKIVVTGLGTVCPLGNSVDAFWEKAIQGETGISEITKCYPADVGYPAYVAGEVRDFDPSLFIDKKSIRRHDLFTLYAIAAAHEAIKHAELLNNDSIDKERVGVIVGSGVGGVYGFQENLITMQEKQKISPFLIPRVITDMPCGMISILHGFMGPNFSISTACATSNHCILNAFYSLQRGEADIIVTGGSESTMSNLTVGGFVAAQALTSSKDINASRPWDVNRNGFVIAEGAGILVLETETSAKKRGVPILAEVLGGGMSADAYHITAPHPQGRGAALAMNYAIKNAGISKEDIQYVNAHGTSTVLGDLVETQAIKQVFKEHSYKLKVNSTKSLSGHLLGAAGGLEAIACIKTLQTGIIHPTINLEEVDPECDLDYVPKKSQEINVKHALSNSFGFGGHNCSVIFKKHA